MAPKYFFVFLLVFCSGNNFVNSATLLEKGYEYFVNLGKNFAPNFLSLVECVTGDDAWGCAREKAGKMLDILEQDVEKEQRSWEEEADAEIRTSGRSMEEMPSKIGRELRESVDSLTNIIGRGMARAMERSKHDHGGGIDSITISTSGDKKMKKKKQKPAKIHLIHPVVMPLRKAHKQEKGRTFGNGVQTWVIGERSLPDASNDSEVATGTAIGEISAPVGNVGEVGTVDENAGEKDTLVENDMGIIPMESGRGVVSDLWAMGQEALDNLAEDVVENEELDNGVKDRSSVEEQRGKKKKKKKAILKLLILGAVIKAKIGTLLQILTYKLQIKFFIVAVLGLAINLARLWIDLKNKHNQQPQKIIYYEHAQHQHHYDHEEEEHGGWGPWSRSILPDDTEVDASEVSPYKAQERSPLAYNTRPFLTRV